MVEVPSKEEFDGLVGHVGDVMLDLSNIEARLAEHDGRLDISGDLANMIAGRLDELVLKVNRIGRRLTALEPVEEVPVVRTVWGSSCGKHTYDYFTQMAGAPLGARRSYQSLGQAFPVEDVGRCSSVTSLAFHPNTIGKNSVKVEEYLRAVPTDHELFFVVSHEPENPNKGYLPVDFVVQQEMVRTIIDRVNVDRLVPILFGGNFMAWSARVASGRDMAPWVPKEGTWDFLAWDGYTDHYYDLPVEVFGDALAFTEARGLRFAIAETGITVDNTPEQRVVWIDQCQQYAKDAGAAFWMYWDGSFWTAYLNTAEEFQAVVNGPM